MGTATQATQPFRVDVGVVDGATLLEWIHQVSHGLATRWSSRHCVAANMGNLHLVRPIRMGETVELHASIVYSSGSTAPKTRQTAQCPIVFVAVDEDGGHVAVSPWTPVTILGLQRHRQARVRIRMRKRAGIRFQHPITPGGAASTSASMS